MQSVRREIVTKNIRLLRVSIGDDINVVKPDTSSPIKKGFHSPGTFIKCEFNISLNYFNCSTL